MEDAQRHAWTKLITAADLDVYLRQVGQAQANAELLQTMLKTDRVEKPTKLLLVGGGTARFLDYVPAACLAPFQLTLTDLNSAFLERARERSARADLQNVLFTIDDIEAAKLSGSYDVVVVVLVLERIDWRRGLRNIQRLSPRDLHIVIQVNPDGLVEAIAPKRDLNRSMHAFAENARPIWVSCNELVDFPLQPGYRLQAQDERPVLDGKTMLRLSFSRS